MRPDSGLTGSSKLKVRSGKRDEADRGGESEESDASDDEDDDYDTLCLDEERNVPIWGAPFPPFNLSLSRSLSLALPLSACVVSMMTNPSTQRVLAWRRTDCVMGSSAAPTYFPSYKRQIDAAVMCNNPALAAISALMSERAAQPKTPKQIHILSLGTGRLSQFIDGDQHDWGMIKWAPYLLQIMVRFRLHRRLRHLRHLHRLIAHLLFVRGRPNQQIGATSLYEQKQAKAILGPRYHRVDPFLPARTRAERGRAR